MKAVLVRAEAKAYWIDSEGEEHEGAPPCVSGDLTGIYGELTGVYGDLSGVYGYLSSGISGDLTGISGNLTNVYGNLDDAEISDAERKKGVSIDDLIKQDQT
jgi:hypothetical protein